MKIKYLMGLALLFLAPICFANFQFSVVNVSDPPHRLMLTVEKTWDGNLYWNGQKIAKGGQIEIPRFPGKTGLLFEASHAAGFTNLMIALSADTPKHFCIIYVYSNYRSNDSGYYSETSCKGFSFGPHHVIYYTG